MKHLSLVTVSTLLNNFKMELERQQNKISVNNFSTIGPPQKKQTNKQLNRGNCLEHVPIKIEFNHDAYDTRPDKLNATCDIR